MKYLRHLILRTAAHNEAGIRRISAVLFVLLFAVAGVVWLFTSRAAPAAGGFVPAVSLACDPGVNAAEFWLMDGNQYHALQSHGQAVLHHGINSATLFYGEHGRSINAGPSGSQVYAVYASYTQFSRDVTNKAIGPGVHWVMYDNENGSSTPSQEQQSPLLYEQQFASLAHAHGYKVILAPSQTLLPGFSQVAFQNGTSYAQAYVTYFAPVTAKYADIWLIQAQPYELANYRSSNAYANLIRTAADAAHGVNPNVIVFSSIGTDQVTAADELYQDWDAARSLVAGFWLRAPNIQDTSSVSLAGQFFSMLPAYAGSNGKVCIAPTHSSSNNQVGAVAQPNWIISGYALNLLKNAGASSALVNAAFNSDRTFVTGDTSGITVVPNAVQTATYTSYQAIVAALANGTLPGKYKAVIYDNEAWSLTPLAEQQDPNTYEQLVATVLHANGLRYIAAPAADIVRATGTLVNDSVYDTYISRNIAGNAATYADVVDIQAQGNEWDIARFSSFVSQATQQARQANPHVMVFAGISTNPNGQLVSGRQLDRAYSAVKTTVDGYWLNIPSQSTACPNCGDPQPGVGYSLLQQIFGTK